MSEVLLKVSERRGGERRAKGPNARIQRFIFLPKELFVFILANTVKLLFVHALLDSYKIDLFFSVLLLEYFSMAMVYFMIPVICRSRLIFLFFYAIQVIYTLITLSYYFVFVSNIHINIISKLFWEFSAVFDESLSRETLWAFAISLIDIFFFYLVWKNFTAIKDTLSVSFKNTLLQIISGFLLFLLIITSVNAYEFIETGSNP
ncbi:MAG: hypothetical protein WCI45_12815, partial [Desulfuromonadales bacterium]